MAVNLVNQDYDFEMVLNQIAAESKTFSSHVKGMAENLDSSYQTERAWLGTIKNDKGELIQVQLVATQDATQFVDED
ncbi:hypothetical protein K6Y31_20635 [Motilimonas cestriensis]|uniref:Uncharacterized protein n=1 Tax=Motilimonas cestriensis TaxID=2742685 RepID=A0ABS8WHS8_9GAMM|nr:hypothetical protein [Motilimonas cestriensis]MCE2597184.1 hypothetical protein [Motilimonas cestriensis]